MKVNRRVSKVLYKKLKYLLKSLFIDLELVKYLTWRKLYKLMWRTMRYDDRFNYTKKELKLLAKEIVSMDFEKAKIENTSLIQTFVSYIIKFTKKILKPLILKSIEKPFVSFFYDEHPLTLE